MAKKKAGSATGKKSPKSAKKTSAKKSTSKKGTKAPSTSAGH